MAAFGGLFTFGSIKSAKPFRRIFIVIPFDQVPVAKAANLKAKAYGKSLEAVQAAQPTAEYTAMWGGLIINGALFTALIHRGV